MAKMQANQMRAGMVIEFEGQRYTILKQNIMIPGKGAAVIQVEMRNVKTGAKKDQRWRTADTVERLTTEDKEFTYSYGEGGNLILMDPETFEQTLVPEDILGDRLPFLQENMTVNGPGNLRTDPGARGYPGRPPALLAGKHDGQCEADRR